MARPVNPGSNNQQVLDAMELDKEYDASSLAPLVSLSREALNTSLHYLAKTRRVLRVARGTYTRPSVWPEPQPELDPEWTTIAVDNGVIVLRRNDNTIWTARRLSEPQVT